MKRTLTPEQRANKNRLGREYNTRHRTALQAKRKIRGHGDDIYKKFGIREHHYLEMLADQESCCACCGISPDVEDRLVVDHKHVPDYEKLSKPEKAKLVRGLLCQGCNLAIGQAKDDSNRLRLCADYLDRANK